MPTPINWPPQSYGSGTGATYTSPEGDSWIWTGYSWESQGTEGLQGPTGPQGEPGATGSQGIQGETGTTGASLLGAYDKELISGGAIWNSGMVFDVSTLSYTFYGPIQYTSGPTQVTLSNGDPTYDRIDAIVVSDDDPFGIVSVVGGTASPNPITPEIPNDQLLVQYVIVPTGVTSLSVNQDYIYNENTEWTGSVYDVGGTGTFNFTATSPTPFLGSVCLGVTGNNRRRWARFTRTSPITASDYSSVSLAVYFPSTIPTSRRLYLRFRLGTSYVGNGIYINPTFANSSVTGSWQPVVVPLYLFNIPGNIDGLDVQLTGINNTDIRNWAVDAIQLQSGISPTYPTAGTQYKPWVIYSQGTGTPTYYANLTQAVNASVSGDTINLLGDVIETLTSTIVINKVRLSINLGGHRARFTAPSSIGNVFDIKAPLSELYFYDGFLIAEGSINGTTDSLINFNVNSTVKFFDVTVRNSSNGYAFYSNGRTITVEGGRFEANNHAFYLATNQGGNISNIVGYTTVQNCHGIWIDGGANTRTLSKSEGSSLSDTGEGHGILFNAAGGMLECTGITKGATNSSGIKIAGKNYAINCEGRNLREDSTVKQSYGMWIEADEYISGCKSISTFTYGTYADSKATFNDFESQGEIGLILLDNIRLYNSTIKGGIYSTVATGSSDIQLNVANSSLNGPVLGSEDFRLRLFDCTVVGNSNTNTIDLGASSGSVTDNSYISNTTFIGLGATYGIFATGGTGRSVSINNCSFIQYSSGTGWDGSTITQSIISSLDPQGNITY